MKYVNSIIVKTTGYQSHNQYIQYNNIKLNLKTNDNFDDDDYKTRDYE